MGDDIPREKEGTVNGLMQAILEVSGCQRITIVTGGDAKELGEAIMQHVGVRVISRSGVVDDVLEVGERPATDTGDTDAGPDVGEFDITKPIDMRQDALLAIHVLELYASNRGPMTAGDARRMAGTIRRLIATLDTVADKAPEMPVQPCPTSHNIKGEAADAVRDSIRDALDDGVLRTAAVGEALLGFSPASDFVSAIAAAARDTNTRAYLTLSFDPAEGGDEDKQDA